MLFNYEVDTRYSKTGYLDLFENQIQREHIILSIPSFTNVIVDGYYMNELIISNILVSRTLLLI